MENNSIHFAHRTFKKKIDKMRVAFSVLLCVWCWEVEFASIFTITNPQINKLRWQLLFVYNNTQKHELQIFECHREPIPSQKCTLALVCSAVAVAQWSVAIRIPLPDPVQQSTTQQTNQIDRRDFRGVECCLFCVHFSLIYWFLFCFSCMLRNGSIWLRIL